MRVPILFCALVGAAVVVFQSSRGLDAQALNSPTFTREQAAAGSDVYARNCASCHGEALDDGEFAPPLRGVQFLLRWGGRPADALFTNISTLMPPTAPGTLENARYVEVMAYVLQQNSLNAGTQPLSSDPAALAAMMMPTTGRAAGGGLSASVPVPPPPVARPNPLERITPVTDAMLNAPPPGDWLTWRRANNAQGFSPLNQITKANVDRLRVAWSWALPNGPTEATPLVHDGVMFAHGYGDIVQALDAANGNLLWQYSRRLPEGVGPSVKRAIAISGDRLFVVTSDSHVVALDVKTGDVIWDHTVVDRTEGFRMTGGPLVAKGKVMVGTVGRAAGGNFIIGLDAATGEEAWRFRTIPRPEDLGGNSWNGLPLEERNGGSVWVPGSYDPDLNLAYFGPAQTYDTGPLRNLADEGGSITNDALFTDATIALNPDTGELVWYFQHQPNDQWDLDWAFEKHLVTLPVNGIPKTVMVTGGKQAIFDAVEADTGRFVFSMDLGLQNIVTAIDPITGAKAVDPNLIPGDGEAKLVCPHAGGAKSWTPSSYNPETRMLYIPLNESCMDLTPVPPGERGSLSTGVRWTLRPRPDTDGLYGRLQAINLETRESVWVDRQRAPRTGGVLVTAGGVVFAGSLDRVIAAYDDATGTQLWRTRLNDVPNASPVSYLANGRQYIAIIVGNGGGHAATWPPLVPEILNPPGRGAAVWVFELPQ